MDFLLKNNVIKASKLIVDIGVYTTKVISAYYASKTVSIDYTESFDSSGILKMGIPEFSDIAKECYNIAQGKEHRDVMVSLPAEFVETKIVSIKNKKEKDIRKQIDKEYASFGKAGHTTHIFDWAYLGKKEEQGDTVQYCLITAAHKNILTNLISAFSKYKMRITRITCSVYNQICLSELYLGDYDYLNRLFVDAGARSTRVVAFSEGIPVYTRTIGIGFDSFADKIFMAQDQAGKPDIIAALVHIGESGLMTNEMREKYFAELDYRVYFDCVNETAGALLNEIRRVIELCGNNDITINKIYSTGFLLPGLEKRIKSVLGVEYEQVRFTACDEKEGRGYIFWNEDALDAQFSNAVGLSVCPML